MIKAIFAALGAGSLFLIALGLIPVVMFFLPWLLAGLAVVVVVIAVFIEVRESAKSKKEGSPK